MTRLSTHPLAALLLLFPFTLPLALATELAHADGGRVTVEITGLRSDLGEVRGALYLSEDGWTEEGAQIATCHASVERRRATCVIEDVPPGTYAFAFLHDENGDGRLARDWLGIPQEGFGFSNDVHPGLGPPSFRSASFVHDVATRLVLRVQYGI